MMDSDNLTTEMISDHQVEIHRMPIPTIEQPASHFACLIPTIGQDWTSVIFLQQSLECRSDDPKMSCHDSDDVHGSFFSIPMIFAAVSKMSTAKLHN